ncbi:DUF305 domain-containing protein [Rhodococcus sp. HNM0563]|uniref:DUF305 domain-containing protein n=1 Tax=unclassified Rhodococcus (in: high G+C Gram-positive bacteria) TaxID=192944 RepID=UPI00146A40D8|nr:MULTISPECIES: DUF305 domain-containing protein [unclassified Rhodococcus (in: high G+C Gram-positive bacteria)]MCK0090604.1 DUF305 domain-containing protein [Rhodococcus sp. F64268]NLU61796.1 DUF305 domain-containing protein [Rhodococcus sp. HNM0563]
MDPKKFLAVGATALAVVFAAAACSDSGTDATATSSPATSSATTSAAEEAAAHNDADVMFAQMMLPHHAQAIEMSDMMLAKADIPTAVTALAEQIKAAQGPEIEQLESWLEQWGEPTLMPHEDHDMPGMDDNMAGMEGMMSEQDMHALADAQGTEAARLFLTQMIAHHEGAVAMAETEIDDGQYPDTVSMARTIVETQQQEIDTMHQLQTTL